MVRFVVMECTGREEKECMARHGENIRKRTDGRWEGRYKVYSEEKGRDVYRSVYGNSYEEVKEKLTTIKNPMRESESASGGPQAEESTGADIDFSSVAEEWQKEIRRKRKHSTCVKYETIYSKYLSDTIGPCQVKEITVLPIIEKIPDCMSDSLLKSIYCVINQILAFSEEHYSVSVPKLRKPVSKEKKKPIEILTRKEQSALIAYLYQKIDIYKLAILLCLYTGLRLGEVCALRWGDIDFKNMIITVNRTVQRIAVNGMAAKTVLLEAAPKSECSRRELPVSDSLLELLKRYGSDKNYVFGGDKPMEPRTLQYRFKKYLRETGLPNKNFHILRHTFATNCVEGGTDVKSLSEMLGHSDVQITLNRYVHPSMDVKRMHLDGLWQFYGQFLGPIS